jgi:hypothetical protein
MIDLLNMGIWGLFIANISSSQDIAGVAWRVAEATPCRMRTSKVLRRTPGSELPEEHPEQILGRGMYMWL